jgi:hypothetical protein
MTTSMLSMCCLEKRQRSRRRRKVSDRYFD